MYIFACIYIYMYIYMYVYIWWGVLKWDISKTMSFNTKMVYMMTWMICGTTISGNLHVDIYIYV